MTANVLDHFNGSAFNSVSLTEAIDLLPALPRQIGSSGLFLQKPVNTLSVNLEYREGTIRLLNTKQRGSSGNTRTRDGRKVRSFTVVHIPHESSIMADSLQGVRQFGGLAADLESITDVVNEELEAHKDDHETTLEYHRAGAINGIVLDADGSTLYNLFDEFGIVQQSFTFAFSTASEGELQAKAVEVKAAVKSSLGATATGGVQAIVDSEFFEAMITSQAVRDSWLRHQDARRAQGFDEDADMFEWGGIKWRRYDAEVGSTPFINGTNIARFYPLGVRGLFTHYMGPADFVEAVNTLGKYMYAKQVRMKFDKGIEMHSQTNPLMLCTRPGCLKVATST